LPGNLLIHFSRRAQQNDPHRVTSPAGSERELAMLSSCARCSVLNTSAAFGRPIAIDTSIVHQRCLSSYLPCNTIAIYLWDSTLGRVTLLT